MLQLFARTFGHPGLFLCAATVSFGRRRGVAAVVVGVYRNRLKGVKVAGTRLDGQAGELTPGIDGACLKQEQWRVGWNESVDIDHLLASKPEKRVRGHG